MTLLAKLPNEIWAQQGSTERLSMSKTYESWRSVRSWARHESPVCYEIMADGCGSNVFLRWWAINCNGVTAIWSDSWTNNGTWGFREFSIHSLSGNWHKRLITVLLSNHQSWMWKPWPSHLNAAKDLNPGVILENKKKKNRFMETHLTFGVKYRRCITGHLD